MGMGIGSGTAVTGGIGRGPATVGTIVGSVPTGIGNVQERASARALLPAAHNPYGGWHGSEGCAGNILKGATADRRAFFFCLRQNSATIGVLRQSRIDCPQQRCKWINERAQRYNESALPQRSACLNPNLRMAERTGD